MVVALLAPHDSPEALYTAGTDAYRAGRYDIAVTAFQAALAQVDRPDLLFSLAQAHRMRYFNAGGIEHLEAAVRSYRSYLDRVPDGRRRIHATKHLATLQPYLESIQVGADDAAADEAPAKGRIIVTSAVDEAEARLADGELQPVPAAFEVEPGSHVVEVVAEAHQPIKRSVVAVAGTAVAIALDPPPIPGKLTVAAPPGARVLVGARRIGSAPLAGPIELPPGPHDVIVLDRGREAVVRPISLTAGEAAQLTVELEPTRQRWVATSAFVAAGVLALGAGATGWLTHDTQREADRLEGQIGAGITAPGYARYRDLEDRRDLYRDATVGLGAVALSAAATGALLWIFDEPRVPAVRTVGALP